MPEHIDYLLVGENSVRLDNFEYIRNFCVEDDLDRTAIDLDSNQLAVYNYISQTACIKVSEDFNL